MSYSCYESDYRNQEQYVYLRDMAVRKAQALAKNESPKEEEKDEKDDFKARGTTTLSFNDHID